MREAWHAWYGLASWKKQRRFQLMVEPTCRMCAAQGRVVAGEVADHIVPVRGDWMRFRTGKLQTLCRHCHESVKRTIEHRGHDIAVDASGMPVRRYDE